MHQVKKHLDTSDIYTLIPSECSGCTPPTSLKMTGVPATRLDVLHISIFNCSTVNLVFFSPEALHVVLLWHISQGVNCEIFQLLYNPTLNSTLKLRLQHILSFHLNNSNLHIPAHIFTFTSKIFSLLITFQT